MCYRCGQFPSRFPFLLIKLHRSRILETNLLTFFIISVAKITLNLNLLSGTLLSDFNTHDPAREIGREIPRLNETVFKSLSLELKRVN
jgi:hypothetical protein